jgi:hypothetical protein
MASWKGKADKWQQYLVNRTREELESSNLCV